MKRGTLEAKNEFRKSMFVDGVIFVLIAALFGSGLTTVDYGFGLITGINGSPFIQVTGLPEFLIPHSNLNVLYSIGMAMILLSIAFTIVDIHNANGRITKFLNFYGRFSLSLFAFHLLVGTWFGNMFTVPLLVIYVVCVWAGLYYFLKMLVLKYKGIGTLEWITARGRSFYETQVKFWREQFQKIKKLFHPVPEYPVENTLEAFIYDALGGMDHMDYGSPPPKPATRRGRRGKKEEKTEIVLEHN